MPVHAIVVLLVVSPPRRVRAQKEGEEGDLVFIFGPYNCAYVVPMDTVAVAAEREEERVMVILAFIPFPSDKI